jgi:hypothetical protein
MPREVMLLGIHQYANLAQEKMPATSMCFSIDLLSAKLHGIGLAAMSLNFGFRHYSRRPCFVDK